MAKYLGEFEPAKCNPYKDYTQADWALEYMLRYGGIDGEHHKTWVIDQSIRILKGTPIILTLAKWDDGNEEYRFITGKPSKEYDVLVKETIEAGYDWDVGCAP